MDIGVLDGCWCAGWMLVCWGDVSVLDGCWCVGWMLVCWMDVVDVGVTVIDGFWCVGWILVCEMDVGVLDGCWCAGWMLVCWMDVGTVCWMDVGVLDGCWCVEWVLVCWMDIGVLDGCWCAGWILVCWMDIGVLDGCWCVGWMLVCWMDVDVLDGCWCVGWLDTQEVGVQMSWRACCCLDRPNGVIEIWVESGRTFSAKSVDQIWLSLFKYIELTQFNFGRMSSHLLRFVLVSVVTIKPTLAICFFLESHGICHSRIPNPKQHLPASLTGYALPIHAYGYFLSTSRQPPAAKNPQPLRTSDITDRPDYAQPQLRVRPSRTEHSDGSPRSL